MEGVTPPNPLTFDQIKEMTLCVPSELHKTDKRL